MSSHHRKRRFRRNKKRPPVGARPGTLAISDASPPPKILWTRYTESALDEVPDGERGTRRVESWLEDPAFTPLQSLVGLAGEEREAWASLWVRMVQRATLSRSRA